MKNEAAQTGVIDISQKPRCPCVGTLFSSSMKTSPFFGLLLVRSATPMFRVALKILKIREIFPQPLEILPVAGPGRLSVGFSSLAVFQMRQNTGQLKLVELPVVFHQYVFFNAQPSTGSGKPFSLTCLGSCEILSLYSHKDVFFKMRFRNACWYVF